MGILVAKTLCAGIASFLNMAHTAHVAAAIPTVQETLFTAPVQSLTYMVMLQSPQSWGRLSLHIAPDQL